MTDRMLRTPVRERTVAAVLERHVAEQPEKIALVDDQRSLTYRELQAAAYRTSNAFHRLGVKRQEFVLVMLDNHIDNVTVWAGLSAGAMVTVPVNSAYKGEMLAHVARTSGARVAVIEGAHCSRFAEIAHKLPALHTVIVRGTPNADFPAGITMLDFLALADGQLERPEPPKVSDIVALLYTSGTEGPSKGVLSPHGHAFQISFQSYLTTDEDVVFVALPLFHASGLFAGVYKALRAGGTAVIRTRFSASSFWSDVRKHGCTQTMLMGAMADFLWRQPPADDDAKHTLRNITVIPAMPYIHQFAERFGVNVTTSYGGAETGTPLSTDPGDTQPSICGRPRSFIEIRLVDDDDLDVPQGDTGEIVVRSREPWSLMAGYHGLSEATAHAWRNLWLHTGDTAWQDPQGRYFFVDRKKDALRRRGENISSLEVEGYLLARPDVAAAAIVAVPSEYVEDEIKAVIVPAAGTSFNPEAILRDLTDRLPYFMVPRYYEAVTEIPMTPTLKVKKHELRAAGITASTWDYEQHGFTVTRDGLKGS